MRFQPLPIAGALRIEVEPREDDRGSFARVFCLKELADQGLDFQVRQANLAQTRLAGTVRGLHYQVAPALERKIVRCVVGEVFDVIVDMRPDSPTFRAVHWERLSATNRVALFVPALVAHGYQTLDDGTDFFYLTDQFYRADKEVGVRPLDPSLAIPWPLPPVGMTARDIGWPLLEAR